MTRSIRTRILAAATAGALVSPLALSHFDDKEIAQSYRQSWFAMVAANFEPMVAMVKQEMPWDDVRVKASADQLATLAAMDVSRGFADGTDKGTTRAKPGIWDNKQDFQQKMEDFSKAAAALKEAAAGGDKKAIAMQVGAVGKTCKSCHDEYKSKDYLY